MRDTIRLTFIKVSILLLIGFWFFCVLTQNTHAATGINPQINFQGKLANLNGTNVTNATYTVDFSLYDSASGGNNLWSETQSVSTANGIFKVALGSVNPFSDQSIFNTDNLYLQIQVTQVNGVPTNDTAMNQRIRFTAVPYAFNAKMINGLTIENTNSATDIKFASNLTFGTGTSGTISLGSNDNSLTFLTTGDTSLTLPTGGTLFSTESPSAKGDLIFASADNTLSLLNKGQDGECLKSTSNTIQWGICGGLFTADTGNGFSYLTDTTSDLVLGASTVADASFFMDVSAGGLYLGTDGLLNGSLNFYSKSGLAPSTIASNDAGDLILSSGSGTVVVGSGVGNVDVDLSSVNEYFTASKSLSVSGDYAGNDFTFSRALSGDFDQSGAVVNITDTSSASTSTVNPDMLLINAAQSGVSFTGNLIRAQAGGADKFTVDGTGSAFFAGNVGIGAESTGAKFDLTFSSTSTSAGDEYGQRLTVSDTGNVSSGTDNTYGQYIDFTRTGAASGGNILGVAQSISATGDSNTDEIKGSSIQASNGNSTVGNDVYASNSSGNTLSSVSAVSGTSQNQSSGTVSQSYGGKYQVSNLGSGYINYGYGINIGSAINSGGGTFERNYGLYINDQSAVGSIESYNLYSAGANSKNYFAGSVEVGSYLKLTANSTDYSSTCTTGSYFIFADSGSSSLKKCQNGLISTIGGGESLFTSDTGNGFSYLTDTTSDLVLGASTVADASFFMDVSAGGLYLGTDGLLNGSLNFYSKSGLAPSTIASNNAGDLILSSGSGTVVVGSGVGNVDVDLTTDAEYFKANKTVSLSSSYAGNDFEFKRDLTGDFNKDGAVVRITDVSSSSTATINPDMLLIDAAQTGVSFSGNLIRAQNGGANKFTVDASGNTRIGGGTSGSRLDVYNNTSSTNTDLFRLISDVGSSQNTVFRVDSSGNIFTDGAQTIGNPADLAEKYPVNDQNISAGEVISVTDQITTVEKRDENGKLLGSEKVAVLGRSSIPYDNNLIGVVSTAPGITLSGYTDGKPVALSGRVPVSVNTENGAIVAGDYLTSSSNPGVAMKALKPGTVIGKALENYNGAGVGKILVFVNVGFADPGNVLANYNFGVSSTVDLNTNISQQSDNGLLFESPAIRTDQLSVGIIGSKDNTGIIASFEGGQLVFKNNLGEKIISFDSHGNATFKGSVNANSLIQKAGGLEVGNNVSSSSGLVNTPAQLSYTNNEALQPGNFQSDKNSTNALDISVLGKLTAEGGLTVTGKSDFKGESLFEGLVTFISQIIFKGDVSFLGRATFNSDTAGFAIVHKGQQEVTVSFEKQYSQLPIVNANINVIKNNSDDDLDQSVKEILSSNIKFVIANPTTHGFKIKLEEIAGTDITFSWTALAVKDAKVSEDLLNSQQEQILSTPIPLSSPEAKGVPLNGSSEQLSSGQIGTLKREEDQSMPP